MILDLGPGIAGEEEIMMLDFGGSTETENDLLTWLERIIRAATQEVDVPGFYLHILLPVSVLHCINDITDGILNRVQDRGGGAIPLLRGSGGILFKRNRPRSCPGGVILSGQIERPEQEPAEDDQG